MNRPIRIVLAFLFTVVAQALFSYEAQAMTIRISNPKIELELSPGETTTGEIEAENPTPDAVKLRVYPEDWTYANGIGEKIFKPAGTMPLSASNWIRVTPSDTVLQPFSKIKANYSIAVPADAKGAYFTVVFFETSLGTAKNDEGVSVLVAGRVGALIFVRVKGTVNRKGEIEEVRVSPPEGNKPMEILTRFKNSGNIDISLTGNFLILAADGKVLGRGNLNTINTFPGVVESRSTQWVGRLPKGTHTLLLTYDLGKGETIVREEPFTVS